MKHDFIEIARSLNESVFGNEVEIKKIYAPPCMVHARLPKEINGSARLICPDYAVDIKDNIIFLNPDRSVNSDAETVTKIISTAMAHLHCLQHGKFKHLL